MEINKSELKKAIVQIFEKNKNEDMLLGEILFQLAQRGWNQEGSTDPDLKQVVLSILQKEKKFIRPYV